MRDSGKRRFKPAHQPNPRQKRRIALATALATSILVIGVNIETAKAEWLLSRRPTDSRLLTLIRDPAVLKELKLSKQQAEELRRFNRSIDAKLLPLRNYYPRAAAPAYRKLMQETQQRLRKILSAAQFNRLAQVMYYVHGRRAILGERFVQRLALSDQQQEAIEEIVAATDEADSKLTTPDEFLQKAQLLKRRTEEDQLIDKLLTEKQRKLLNESAGEPFARSRLMGARYRAPRFEAGDWIQTTTPLKMADFYGKVVVIHFYAFG